jgi:hypothetical protein
MFFDVFPVIRRTKFDIKSHNFRLFLAKKTYFKKRIGIEKNMAAISQTPARKGKTGAEKQLNCEIRKVSFSPIGNISGWVPRLK